MFIEAVPFQKRDGRFLAVSRHTWKTLREKINFNEHTFWGFLIDTWFMELTNIEK